MLNLNKEQMERRVALLKELYADGYRYIGASDIGTIMAGKSYSRKAVVFGVWSFEDAKNIQSFKTEENLFPDVKWDDEKPMDIEYELKKSKFRVV